MGNTGVSPVHNSAQTTGYVLTLGLLLLSLTTAGVALGGLTEAESQSSPVEISNWTDLRAIDDNSTTLSDDYVLVNDLNKTTPGYTTVVLNQTATEFTERVFFERGDSRVNLTRTPVAELLSNNKGLNLTVVDSANGTLERDNTSSLVGADVTYTTSTAQVVGFSPIGSSFSERFTGRFDGQGHTIRDLLIDRPTDDGIGVFGFSEGTLTQVTVAHPAITGSDEVGGLVGRNDGTVSNSSASGDVTGSNHVGGLVGRNYEGTVTTSAASGAVTGSKEVGGLVGENFQGTVDNSSARSAVNATGFSSVELGGLVGYNFDGSVSTSTASGAVTGFDRVGGLVGSNVKGTVSSSSASGDVAGSEDVGGLVGFNGLTGFDGTVSNSSASGDVIGSGDVGGLVGENEQGTVSESFATGAVTGSLDVGGLIGRLGSGLLDPGQEAILRNSYYDTQTTGQQTGVGAIAEGSGTAERRGEVAGFVTTQLQGVSAAQNMGALDFTTTWQTLTDPPRYPELRALPSNPDPDPDPDPNLAFLAQAVTNQGTVLIQDVISEGPALVLVTYEADGDTVVAGVANGTFNGENVTVTLQADFGFPEDYTAHLVPASEVSQIYTPGETVSSTTTNAVLVNQTSRVTTVTNAPDVVVVNAPAKDTTGDGLLDDVRGDGRLDIFDVQTLFSSRNDPAVKDNAEFFDFQPGSTPVSIFDIQALFTLYIEN
jgi:hypothetical protein